MRWCCCCFAGVVDPEAGCALAPAFKGAMANAGDFGERAYPDAPLDLRL